MLRDPEWLDRERALAWCRVLAIVTAIGVAIYLATSRDGLDYFGKPLGTDFISFWTASRLALSGHVAAAYDPAAHEAAERALLPLAVPGYFAFFYPPPFLLLCLPLALLPYAASLAVWLVAGLAAFVTCLRRILPRRWALLPICAFPGILANAGHGQNGFVTASCLGWSMLLTARRPFLAGTILGLLVIKPHLLLAAPVALLAARRWRMIAGAITSALALTALSWIVLGSAAFVGFFDVSGLARATLEQGLVAPWKMQSVFAATRLLGGGVGLAWLLQGGVAIVVCVTVAGVAARRSQVQARGVQAEAVQARGVQARGVKDRGVQDRGAQAGEGQAEGAMLVAASLLCTPFLLDYDLICLGVPIAWVMAEAQRTGWRPFEKIVLLSAYILPIAARPLALISDVSVAPYVMVALLAMVARRAVR